MKKSWDEELEYQLIQIRRYETYNGPSSQDCVTLMDSVLLNGMLTPFMLLGSSNRQANMVVLLVLGCRKGQP